jgi:muramidase (phage lysozyme)
VAKKLHLTDFSPASQDRAALALAGRDYRKRSGGRDLNHDLENGKFDPRYLQKTWVSIRNHGARVWMNGQFLPAMRNAVAFHRNLSPTEYVASANCAR